MPQSSPPPEGFRYCKDVITNAKHIGPLAICGDHVHFGNGARISDKVKIGKYSEFGKNVKLGYRTRIGESVKVPDLFITQRGVCIQSNTSIASAFFVPEFSMVRNGGRNEPPTVVVEPMPGRMFVFKRGICVDKKR